VKIKNFVKIVMANRNIDERFRKPRRTKGGGGGGIHCPFTMSGSSQSTSPFESNIISKRFSSANSLGPFSTTIGDLNLNGINPYEKWSNGGTDTMFQNGTGDPYSLSSAGHADPMLDLTSKLMSTAIFPPKSQIKRQKMIYHCKFGEFGVMEGQFTEPSGVAVNAQNDIIVADTNNHRIQIFDKEGRFKFQFGECGKRDGQLLYPNRVAVVRTSGDIIVTERSPTHQIQIYNQYGQFVRKFGANILQHPRGVTVDNKGRIVVVECKVMRVIIFDQSGTVLQKFGCSKHLEFPNGVVVNDKQEIFISDNRAHCVKVFSYEGVYLRQIGGEGITNYPIGVGINANGEILIADNHNNFNLTIFTQDGQLVSALESKVKHAQCFDVALMDDGSVVLASKDYRLYIYRYVQVPPIGL
jgi:tripartite motif-containing protein 2/3